MTDAKFQWFNAMYADRAISLAQRGVIGYCGIRYAKAEQGYLIKVNQQTIADNLGIRRATVSEALRAGERRRWLHKEERAKGGRGHHGGDTWTLTTPVETCTRNSTGFDETCTPNDENVYAKPQKPVRESGETCTRANAPARENAVPKGIEKGIEEGFLEQGSAFSALGSLFDGARVIKEQPALEAAVEPVQAARPLTDDDRCKRHETPDPQCYLCKAFARARGEAL